MKRLDAEKGSARRESAGLGRPLRVPAFRNLLIADLVSDIGTFMQSVGAAWLMVSLHAGSGYVALVQTAASLPYFLLALPAGSAGDIFDRRRLVLFTEVWQNISVNTNGRQKQPANWSKGSTVTSPVSRKYGISSLQIPQNCSPRLLGQTGSLKRNQ